MSEKEKYLFISSNKKIKIIDTIEEINNLEFDSIEDAKKSQIFLIEFKDSIKFSTKVSLSIRQKNK